MTDSSKEELTLNKEFYDISCIKKAAREFSSACIVHTKKTKKGVIVGFKPKRNSKSLPSGIEKDFANYVLVLMKNEGIV